MRGKHVWGIVVVVAALLGALLTPVAAAAADQEFVFGLLLVGPYNDRGWSQAHYEGGCTFRKRFPGPG